MYAQHDRQWVGMTAPPSLGIEGIDAAFQLLPRDQPVHPLQEQFPSGLALLPLVFQTGKEPALVKTGVGCSIPIHLSTGLACLPLLCHNFPDLFRVSLALEASGYMPELALDRMRMSQALGNVIGNALNCTRAGGNIQLEAGLEGDEALAISITETGSA